VNKVLNDIEGYQGSITDVDLHLYRGAYIIDSLVIENVHIKALNNFLEAYAKVDAEQGVFHVYAEMLLLDGQLDGYVKPLLVDVKLIDWSDDDKSVLMKIWEVVVDAVLEIFENQPNDQFATKVPISGDLSDTDAGILSALWNILSNAFAQAFDKDTDGTINFNPESENEKSDK